MVLPGLWSRRIQALHVSKMSEYSVRLNPQRAVSIDNLVDLAERTAFSAKALAIKLAELDEACIACDAAYARKTRIHRECEALLREHEDTSRALIRKVES